MYQLSLNSPLFLHLVYGLSVVCISTFYTFNVLKYSVHASSGLLLCPVQVCNDYSFRVASIVSECHLAFSILKSYF